MKKTPERISTLEENGKRVTIETEGGDSIFDMIQDLIAPMLLAQTYSAETIASGFIRWVEENVPSKLNEYGLLDNSGYDDDEIFDPRGYGMGGDHIDDYDFGDEGYRGCAGDCNEGYGSCEQCMDDEVYKTLGGNDISGGDVEINFTDESGKQRYEEDGKTPLRVTLTADDFDTLAQNANMEGKTIEELFKDIIQEGLLGMVDKIPVE